MIGALDLSVGADGGGVVQVAVAVHEAHHGGAAAGAGGQLGQRLQVVLDEAGLEQQVLGWVAGDGQLGEHGHVGPGVLGLLQGGQDALHVALQVAHDRVELAGGDPHSGHGQSVPGPARRPLRDHASR